MSYFLAGGGVALLRNFTNRRSMKFNSSWSMHEVVHVSSMLTSLFLSALSLPIHFTMLTCCLMTYLSWTWYENPDLTHKVINVVKKRMFWKVWLTLYTQGKWFIFRWIFDFFQCTLLFWLIYDCRSLKRNIFP